MFASRPQNAGSGGPKTEIDVSFANGHRLKTKGRSERAPALEGRGMVAWAREERCPTPGINHVGTDSVWYPFGFRPQPGLFWNRLIDIPCGRGLYETSDRCP
jgi:hypothetical protein